MRILAVDDEKLSLLSLQRAIEEAEPNAELVCFRKPSEALEYAGENPCDVAFLDVEMRGKNGIVLAKELKDIFPKVNIIFVTGFSQYALDAVQLHASGFIEKPVTAEAIRTEMENLRNPVETQSDQGKDIRVQTFGNFEIYVKDQPVAFTRSKSKEILAYLIDRRGASVSRPELAGVLWEDSDYTRSQQKQLQIYISDLMKNLKAVGAEDLILRTTGQMSVDTTKFDCDYYSFLNMDSKAINSYQGEYMANYSWAEFTTGYLEQQLNNMY